ncbi:MAG TPA: metal-sulfur cluster assembly factor [Azospirillum sp.]|nr:metal-sulfur cluster assembly factor [Azospirillum sp.]
MVQDKVRDALRTVIDPEMGIDVVELGLVYGIDVAADNTVAVRLTMTSPACPLGEFLRESAECAIRAAVPEAPAVTVELTFEPPWTPDLISPDARRQLGWPEA